MFFSYLCKDYNQKTTKKLLFGGKKIPELMKGLGKGVKSFKDGMKDIDESTKDETKEQKDE